MTPPPFHRQFALVFGRTMRDGLGNAPLAFIAPTMLAVFIAVIFGAVFNSVANTPGFPTDTFIEWVAPASVLLTAFVGAGYAAGALLRDIETGYLDRLRLLPVHPAALVLGRATFEAVRIVVPASIVLGGSLLAGARNDRGIGGFVAVIAITCFVAVTWNGVFFLVALKSGSQQAVLGLQPLFMPIIMFSTFFAPTLDAPSWFRTVAAANPFTSLLDATRGILIGSVDTSDLAIGLLAFAAIGAVTYTASAAVFAGLVKPD